jgi:hypothetical protein
MTRALSQLRPVPRRGLSHDEAAMYVGVSSGKFDEMINDGRIGATTDRCQKGVGRSRT